MKQWSPTGCVFSAVFLAIAIWCLISISQGHSDPIWLLSFLTMPVSQVLSMLAGSIQSPLGLSDEVAGWSITVLSAIWGVFMFYFFGWLLERPLWR